MWFTGIESADKGENICADVCGYREFRIQREGTDMNKDTERLLEECNSGCKMAIGSMKQISEYAENDNLREVLAHYKDKHEELEKKSSGMLKVCGKEEKEPGVMAAAFAWFTTEVKMMIQDDSSQIAKIMMNGCNMGIQSISEYQHEFAEASDEAQALAGELVRVEEDFMKDLKPYL